LLLVGVLEVLAMAVVVVPVVYVLELLAFPLETILLQWEMAH
jgi:hypothetical protein